MDNEDKEFSRSSVSEVLIAIIATVISFSSTSEFLLRLLDRTSSA